MMTVEIMVNEDVVKASLGKLYTQSGVIISRAANRSITTARKALRQETAKIYEFRGTDVEHSLKKISRASRAKTFAEIDYSNSHKNLFHIKSHGRSVVSPPIEVKTLGRGINTPEVYKAHVMKAHSGGIEFDQDPKAFLRRVKSNGALVFLRRTGEKRYPLEGVGAPAVTQVMKNKEVNERFIKDTADMMAKRLIHETDYLLQRSKAL